MEQYSFEDIISLPHHVSPTRPRMKRIDRAAQFSPFSALNGYEAAIREAGRLTQRRIELSEDCMAALDRKQAKLLSHLHARPEITVVYFLPDERKQGGRYVTRTGRLKGIDTNSRLMLLHDGTSISLCNVLDLDSPLFHMEIDAEESSQQT